MPCKFCNKEYRKVFIHEPFCKRNPNRRDGWSKGQKRPHPRWKEQYPNDKIFIRESTFARHSIKARILNDDLIEYKCKICGCDPWWQGKPMVLILDHINGINNDNRLNNLRFICSNCDSQLPTYKARNKNRKYNPMDGDGT